VLKATGSLLLSSRRVAVSTAVQVRRRGDRERRSKPKTPFRRSMPQAMAGIPAAFTRCQYVVARIVKSGHRCRSAVFAWTEAPDWVEMPISRRPSKVSEAGALGTGWSPAVRRPLQVYLRGAERALTTDPEITTSRFGLVTLRASLVDRSILVLPRSSPITPIGTSGRALTRAEDVNCKDKGEFRCR
jgi:hypothetical protein